MLYALGIRHVGEKAARELAGRFGSIHRLREADREALEQMPGIGPVVAEAVVKWFRQPEMRALIKRLEAAGVTMAETVRAGPQLLAGTTFVFTGELSQMSRAQAEALIRKLGGEASSTVSQLTTYLVVGETPGSKLEQAKRLDVTIIDEAKFLRMVKT